MAPCLLIYKAWRLTQSATVTAHREWAQSVGQPSVMAIFASTIMLKTVALAMYVFQRKINIFYISFQSNSSRWISWYNLPCERVTLVDQWYAMVSCKELRHGVFHPLETASRLILRFIHELASLPVGSTPTKSVDMQDACISLFFHK